MPRAAEPATAPEGATDPPAVHEIPADAAALLLRTDPDRGLSEAEAGERLRQFGPNAVEPPQRRGPLTRLLMQLHNPLIYVLIVAGTLTIAIGQTVDGAVIFGVVVANAAVGFIQEGRAERALAALAALLETEATVLREGHRRTVPAERLVPGDLLLLSAGDRVPADLRLIGVDELAIDESALTGESLPASKHSAELAGETVVAERHNMAYSGTLATRGHGRGIVVATGAGTELGLIHRLLGTTEAAATPLTRQMAAFSRTLTLVILVFATLAAAIALARGWSAADAFVAAVALAVGAIPEALPAAITVALAIGVTRMARRHAVVRRLPAVEALGSATVICADKTGTLTKNEMTVRAIAAGDGAVELSGVGYSPEGQLVGHQGELVPVPGSALAECLTAGALCNNSKLARSEGRWRAIGDPTEVALLVSARKAGLDARELRSLWPRIDAVPFDSRRQYMATLHRSAETGEARCYVKGGTERVLALCESRLDASGQGSPLDREAVLAEAERLAARGLRVLGLARSELPPQTATLDGGERLGAVRFLGLQAMEDPPRPEAEPAVARCHDAGIEVKMITGDHAATAAAVAERVGIVHPGEDPRAAVVEGRELERTRDPERLGRLVGKSSVFARVSPEQKLRLVDALLAREEVVTMTGDGVNDAPALKRADIGVAMGEGGTDVAKEAADIVLTDDNFASIEAAVEEGRRTFDNITKFIVWTLPTNIGEGLLILTALVVGATLPVLPVQILWINTTTAVALGLMLAFEAQEPGSMLRPPRDPSRPILTGALIGRIVLVSALMLTAAFSLFEWSVARGASDPEARTVAVNVFVMIEVLYLLNCRSLERSLLRIGPFSNPWVLGGIAVTIGLQLLFTYAPQMNELFHTAPIDAAAWVRIIAAALAAYLLVGAEKWLRRRIAGPSAPPAVIGSPAA